MRQRTGGSFRRINIGYVTFRHGEEETTIPLDAIPLNVERINTDSDHSYYKLIFYTEIKEETKK